MTHAVATPESHHPAADNVAQQSFCDNSDSARAYSEESPSLSLGGPDSAHTNLLSQPLFLFPGFQFEGISDFTLCVSRQH